MDINTIQEKFKLPSKGKLYKDVPEELTLRSMTTEEELRRLSQRGRQYQKLCDILDACIIETMPISTYDMCLGDYQALIYGLRTVTYGSNCFNPTICPKCGKVNKHEVDLFKLKLIEFEDFKPEDLEVVLPRTQKKVTLKIQTPRMLDEIEKEVEDFKSKNPESDLDMNFLYTLKHSIEYVDGVHYDPIKMESFLRKLPMADTNVLIQKTVKINDKVGIDTSITEKCDSCGSLYDATFRINSEFFGPTID